MNVGLIDIDGKMPNLALMKLSAHYRLQGCKTELTTPVFAPTYDKVYLSKVFTWSDMPCLSDNIEAGGTGYDLRKTLPDNIERLCPDYALYKIDYSMGFLTRGCIRKCAFCFVPEKEGNIRPAADIEDFLRHKKAVLLDNNVLAHEHGLRQIEKIIRLGIRVDFNQGLDARLIDGSIAKLLARVKWLKPIRLACDTKHMMEPVKKAVELLRKYGAKPKNYFCYLLVADDDDIDHAYNRAIFLKKLGVDPFAQPYRSASGAEPSFKMKNFARWVNHKAIFNTVRWQDYKKRGGGLTCLS